jgi:hypothetical protein
MRVLANYPMKVHRIAIFMFVPDFETLIADEALLMRILARRIESPPAGRYLNRLGSFILRRPSSPSTPAHTALCQ